MDHSFDSGEGRVTVNRAGAIKGLSSELDFQPVSKERTHTINGYVLWKRLPLRLISPTRGIHRDVVSIRLTEVELKLLCLWNRNVKREANVNGCNHVSFCD